MTRVDRLAHASAWKGRAVAEKGIIAGIGLALALLVPPWPGGLLITAVSLGIALVSVRVDPVQYARILVVPLGFLALSGAAIAVGVTRDASGLSLEVTRGSLVAARDVTVRAVAATAAALLLALTTPVPQLVGALRSAGVPRELVEIMVLVYRFVFALEGAGRATIRAQTARLGFASPSAARRSVGLFAATLFGKAMDRAARLDRALASRGGTASLTTLRSTPAVRLDRLAFFVILYGAATLLALVGPTLAS